MASPESIRRIVYLLRMAKNQAGTPAGDTYAAKAQELQERHGITVVLEDQEEVVDERPTAIVGHYDARTLWRDNLIAAIQRIYDIEFCWNHVGNLLALTFRDREDHRSHLRAAVEMYLRLEQAVEFYRFLPPPAWTRQLPHNDCVALFRGGLANGVYLKLYEEKVDRPTLMLAERSEESIEEEIAALREEIHSVRNAEARERLERLVALLSTELEARRAAADASSTAMVPLRHVSAPTADPGQVLHEDGIPRDHEVPQGNGDNIESHIYGMGVYYGRQLPLPALVRSRA